MKTADKEILSTFIEFMRSLEVEIETTENSCSFENENMILVKTGINEQIYNNVFIKKSDRQAHLIDDLIALKQSIQLPLTVWITAETEKSDIIENLLRPHFVSPGPFYGMKLDLEQANIPPNLMSHNIEEVSSNQQAEDFANAHCDIFNFDGLRPHIIRWAKKQLQMHSPNAVNYIVRVDGEIAGVSSLVFNEAFNEYHAGGFYNAGVYEAYRKKGVAMAMACHRIQAARERNLQSLSIVLMSDAMARGYCEYLGFSNHARITPYYIE